MGDKRIECVERNCGTIFILTEKEQEFYRSKGFEEPKRCKNCRKIRKGKAQNDGRNETV